MRPTIRIEALAGGGHWSFDLLRDRLDCEAHAACFRGRDELGRPVFVKGVEEGDEEGRERAEREVAALARIGRHPRVLTLRGTAATVTGHSSYRVFEWADVALHELLDGYAPTLRDVLAQTIEEELSAALRAVHGAGLVHCDVAPNNVVRVQGRWKLADFDVSVRAGEATVGQPRLGSYLSEGREVGMPARPQFDWDALAAIVAQVRGGPAEAAIEAPRAFRPRQGAGTTRP